MAVTRLRWQSVAIGGNQWQSVAIGGNYLRTRVGRDESARLRFKSLRGAKGANGGYAGERLREL